MTREGFWPTILSIGHSVPPTEAWLPGRPDASTLEGAGFERLTCSTT